MGIDHGCYRVCGVVKAINKLKAQGNQQGNRQQEEREAGRMMHVTDIGDQVCQRIDNSDCDEYREDEDPGLVRSLIDFAVYRFRNRRNLLEARKVWRHWRCRHEYPLWEGLECGSSWCHTLSLDHASVHCKEFWLLNKSAWKEY